MTDDAQQQGGYPFRATFWFTVCYLLISHGRIHLLVPVLISIPSAMISGMLAVLAFMFEYSKLRPEHVWCREEKLVLGLVGVCLVTLPTSIWLGGSVTGLYKTFLPMILLMFITGIICRSAADISRFIWVLLANNALITYYLLSKEDVGHFTKGITDTYDTNDIAMIICCSLPILFFFMQRQKGAKKLVLVVCLALLVVTVIMTSSRGGMLGLIALGGYSVVFVRSKFKYGLMVLAASILFFQFAPEETKERFVSMYKPQTEYDQNLGDRTQIWETGIQLFWQNPVLGVGFGNYTVADGSMKERGAWKNAHNSLLQVAVELGIAGLVLMIMLTAGTFFKFRKLRKQLETSSRENELLWLVKGIELSLLAYMVTAFFLSQAYSGLFYFIISLAIAVQKLLPHVDDIEIAEPAR